MLVYYKSHITVSISFRTQVCKDFHVLKRDKYKQKSGRQIKNF